MRRNYFEGSYSITGPGIDASAPSLGEAISKAQTLASKLQKGGGTGTIYVRKLGQEVAVRLDVEPKLILTYPYAD